MEKKLPTSFRLSAEALELLEWLAKHLGVSQAAVLEMLIREKARKEKAPEANSAGA
jgi:predicted DNA-binding protein